CITSGNHVWSKKEIIPFLNNNDKVLRPLNYPAGVPGKGYEIYKKENFTIAVVNLIGRIFLDPVDCPFRAIDNVVDEIIKITPLIVVDFHAEATAEKIAMKYFINGKVSALIGTHTHVQTSDEQISEKGMCYITDVGMTGPIKSVIGMKIEDSIDRLLTQIPRRLDTAKGESKLEGVVFSLANDGRCTSIERIRVTG
ncbi:MAG TPA: YmdB family metallophosphoesterase, partial [Candidatus Atribacteria bacterium]|nr:YmdB family metallophosphoesterase [Candidatus Atribacteria bacterium]